MPLTAHSPFSIVLDVEYVWSSTSWVAAAAAASAPPVSTSVDSNARRVEQDKAIGSSCNNAVTEQEEKRTQFSRSWPCQKVWQFPSSFHNIYPRNRCLQINDRSGIALFMPGGSTVHTRCRKISRPFFARSPSRSPTGSEEKGCEVITFSVISPSNAFGRTSTWMRSGPAGVARESVSAHLVLNLSMRARK